MVRSYPGKPSCSVVAGCQRRSQTDSTRRPRSEKRTEGGRFTDSTNDSGPRKPGNSVEEKTLTIRKRKTISPGLALSIASMREGKPWTKGGSDGTAESTQCGAEGPEIKWGRRISRKKNAKMGIHHGLQAPGPGHEAPSRRQSAV